MVKLSGRCYYWEGTGEEDWRETEPWWVSGEGRGGQGGEQGDREAGRI